MTFVCEQCHHTRDFDTEYGIFVITFDKKMFRICSHCRRPAPYLPDVFWDGKPEVNLADDPNTGKPRIFNSPGEKARYLKERGIQEAGDPVHGAPFSVDHGHLPPCVDSRDEAKRALSFVKKMGRDVRRREYLRIIKKVKSPSYVY